MATPEQPQMTEEQQRQTLATGRLFQTMANDPKYRKKVLGLIKDAAPEVVIPELEMDAEIDRRVGEARKPLDESYAALAKRQDDLERKIGRENFKRDQHLSEDELVEVEELATKAKIGDAGTAVEHWRMQLRLGAPRSTRTPDADQDYLQTLRKIGPRNVTALKKAATERARQILNESRTRRAG
jgi:hypothetical protein